MIPSKLAGLIRAAVALVLLISASLVSAHQQGSSYSQWQLGEKPSVQLRISALDLTRVALHAEYTPDYHQRVLAYVQRHLRLEHHGQPCVAMPGQVSVAQPGWLALDWTYQCAYQRTQPQWQIETSILLAEAPGHLHFARVIEPAGNAVAEATAAGTKADASAAGVGETRHDQLLTSRSPSWFIDLAELAVSSGFASYLWLGAIHIWEGWDHLAFVLALLLLATSWRQLAWLISGFTVGHSVTLVLATVGWLAPNIGLIEAVIAWSIALLAAELLRQQSRTGWYWWLLPLGLLGLSASGNGEPIALLLGLALFTLAYATGLSIATDQQQAQLRTAITIAFGLIHGCGFAAVLAELSLPQQQLFSSLLGFNLGVELGQLAIVLPLWPVLRLAQRHMAWWVCSLAYGLLALSSYWWWLRVA